MPPFHLISSLTFIRSLPRTFPLAPRPSVPSCRRSSHPRCLHSRASPSPPLRILDVNGPPVRYQTAWQWQQDLCRQLRKDPAASDVLLMLEHQPVYTLGTASNLDYVLFDAHELLPTDDFNEPASGSTQLPDLVRTERGGEVTYHGPGQLVVYPLVNLVRHRKDLHWYLRQLEETVILLLADCGLSGSRRDGLTGVWVGNKKIAAMGLKVSRWVTMHGLALNVNTALEPFQRIVPCGIEEEGLGVTSLQELLAETDVDICEVRKAYVRAFCQVFGPYEPDWFVAAEVDVDGFCAEEVPIAG